MSRPSIIAVSEAPEARRMLDDYVFNGTGAGESLFAQMQGANLVVGINGGSGINIPNPAGKTVRIYAQGGSDQIHLVSNGERRSLLPTAETGMTSSSLAAAEAVRTSATCPETRFSSGEPAPDGARPGRQQPGRRHLHDYGCTLRPPRLGWLLL